MKVDIAERVLNTRATRLKSRRSTGRTSTAAGLEIPDARVGFPPGADMPFRRLFTLSTLVRQSKYSEAASQMAGSGHADIPRSPSLRDPACCRR